jgi:acetate---CoA ligase (ADP-forming)
MSEKRESALDAFFRPASIAIVGASEDFVKINGRPLKFLLDKGYGGKIFPVNPKYTTLAGLACHPSVSAIGEPVDLAIVAVPAAGVAAAVRDCAASGVRTAVVFSSGFGEMGDDGRRLELEVASLARAAGLRLCGPNTLGFMNGFDRVMATFSQAGEGEAPPGPVGFVTQSGAFGTAIFALARQRGLGLGYFVNSGNEADLELADFLAYVVEDPRIRVIAGYIEGVKDGRRLVAAAERAMDLGKPIVMVKVARFSAGARAASSHTGSLAGADRVYSGAFRQAGIIRAQNDEQLLDLVAAFTSGALPAGGGVGLVTQSGGAGVLMADRCEELGLSVPELTAATREALRQVVPAFGAVRNPVDITAQFIADPQLLVRSLSLVLDDPRVDAAIFYLGLMERAATRIADDLRKVAAGSRKPLIVAWAGAPEAGLARLREGGICVLPSATRAVDAVHGLVTYSAFRRRRESERGAQRDTVTTRVPETVLEAAHAAGRTVLTFAEAFRLLARYGISSPRAQLARSADEAARIVRELDAPAALKIESPAIPHKTEAGALRLGIADGEQARRAFDEIVASARRHAPRAEIDGVLVQAMAPRGVEMVLGLHLDPQFGPVVMVGLGGVFVEVLEDVAFGLAPLTRAEAEEMLRGLRGARLLEGVRGRPRADSAALVEAMVALSHLGAEARGKIRELDINPLIVLDEGRGVLAVDVLVLLAGAGR